MAAYPELKGTVTKNVMYSTLKACRICESGIQDVFDLGSQVIASRFPEKNEADPPSVPLVLSKCTGDCGLVQLKHTVTPDEMYLHNYGYRSGLNESMQAHLKTIVNEMTSYVNLRDGDSVLDIGSNDSTLLSYYPTNVTRIGIDPTGEQFRSYYPSDVKLVPDFFSGETYNKHFGDKKVRCVTTISMFYDLPRPLEFVRDVASILSEDGVWIMEQSYMPTMLERNSFDTICHEHLEYYTFQQIAWMCDKAKLKIIDVTRNDCNGGSFRVVISHMVSPYEPKHDNIQTLVDYEKTLSPTAMQEFDSRCQTQKQKMLDLLTKLRSEGKTVCLYGASTKGNTLLQYYGIDSSMVICAAERNPQKFGCRTPLTNIPIVSEEEVRALKPDYMIVLPWHFREGFLVREQTYLVEGGHFIFPLPEVDIV